VWSQNIKDNAGTQHHHLSLLMKKKSIKWKKYGSTEHEDEEHSTWYIGRVMRTNMING